MAQQASILHEVHTKIEDMHMELIEHMSSVREALLDEHGAQSQRMEAATGNMILCNGPKAHRDMNRSPVDVVIAQRALDSNADQGKFKGMGDDSTSAGWETTPPPQLVGSTFHVTSSMVSDQDFQGLSYPTLPKTGCTGTANGKKETEKAEYSSNQPKEAKTSNQDAKPLMSEDFTPLMNSTAGSRSASSAASLSPSNSNVVRRSHTMEMIKSTFKETNEDYWLRKLISGPGFEGLCAAVIITNAFTIGISAQEAAVFAVSNPGVVYVDNNYVIGIMNKIYIGFYSAELTIKLLCFRKTFFLGENWRWNLFDLILVTAGMYDLVTEFAGGSGGMNVTGLRVLRIVKTLKLLRVIRVMRFFQVLRLMVSSIAGSMMTLFWSILMISIMMYMFGLCFLQAVVGYLNEHPEKEIPEETMTGIKMYWSSVEQAMMTLFWAVTGGADWEPLAMPIRKADTFFYCLFFFYIAFAAFAVLNVLTGMFVDTAMKVAEQDEENVVEELMNRPELEAFKHFATSQAPDTPGFISAEWIKECKDHTYLSFQNLLEITQEDCKRVLAMMDSEGVGIPIDLDEFIKGCCHIKGSVSGLDMIFLQTETKRLTKLVTNSMDYVEERFNEVLKLSSLGMSHVTPWNDRVKEQEGGKPARRPSNTDAGD
jgi:hypothetical protein